ncbi:MAG TPA: hypothetical protein VMQ73_00890, partial [Methylomirabilota bacterium]|nr:hypothetical protein [Methylomirabilota bacterium]
MLARRILLIGSAALPFTGLWSRRSWGDDTVKPVHALAMHGDPKYPADFKHFDYVNPDAPKGG